MPLSASTVHRIIARQDLIRERDSRRPATNRFERSAPNELWQMDFKGSLPNGTSPVGPLSIVDDHSRYILALEHLGSTRMEGVKRRVQRAFEEAGLPDAMLVDHGTPWWNAASPWGITELAVWIMRQGVRLKFSGIRHPQTQGKVERMHGALDRAVRLRTADAENQAWLNVFRHEYNHVRPHEALGMATPASRWRPSPRAFQPHPREWEYGPEMEVRRLGCDGQLGWRGRRWEISCALRRQRVGIGTAGERAIVFFCNTPMRTLELATGQARPVAADAFDFEYC